MKKLTIAIAALMGLSTMTTEAQIFQIEKNDGSLIELEVSNIKEMRFKTDANPYDDKTPDNVEIVDLGLSVNWASVNLGAETVYEPGNLFAWAEIASKEWYSWSTYKYGASAASLTKYNQSDALSRLQNEDDAAKNMWGGDWRMPTRAEFQELIDNCDIDYTATEGGYSGVRLTSKVEGYEGASIFLPACGWIQDEYPTYDGQLSTYWTSECVNSATEISMPSFAFAAEFWIAGDYANSCQINGTYRYLGRPVRAVVPKDNQGENPGGDDKVAVWDGATSTASGSFEGDMALNDDITMTLTKNSAIFQPVFQTGYFLLRNKNSMTIKGTGLKKIVLTFNPDTEASTADKLMPSQETYTTSDDLKTGTWEGTADEVTFTATGGVQITKVEVYY
ncbi:MAG: hypothetical protein IJ613_01470 [Muribaculaceae bacterium]|nr:hypothetical protein [Muribaculaceae bacterium]